MRITKKLKSNAGETLAEVLIALLISSLAILMLAGMISSSSGIILRSEAAMKAYTAGAEGLTNPATAGGTISLKKGTESTASNLLGNDITALYAENDKAPGNIKIITYKKGSGQNQPVQPAQNPEP